MIPGRLIALTYTSDHPLMFRAFTPDVSGIHRGAKQKVSLGCQVRAPSQRFHDPPLRLTRIDKS